jgi:hypothetical protein
MRVKIAVYCENHPQNMKPCGKNAKFLALNVNVY